VTQLTCLGRRKDGMSRDDGSGPGQVQLLVRRRFRIQPPSEFFSDPPASFNLSAASRFEGSKKEIVSVLINAKKEMVSVLINATRKKWCQFLLTPGFGEHHPERNGVKKEMVSRKKWCQFLLTPGFGEHHPAFGGWVLGQEMVSVLINASPIARFRPSAVRGTEIR
jgi:hypothetical protein